MTYSLNTVILSGRISQYGVKLTYLPSGKPAMSLTLVLERVYQEKTFFTYIPIQVFGPQAEPLAETLEAGDFLLIEGSLGYKTDRRPEPDKRPAMLAVSCFGVEVLQRAEVPTATT